MPSSFLKVHKFQEDITYFNKTPELDSHANTEPEIKVPVSGAVFSDIYL